MTVNYLQVNRLPDDEVKELVKRLLAGDESAIPEIAECYIPFAMSIARGYAHDYPQRRSDIQGSALLGLTEGVTRFMDKAYDENIVPYIARTIHRYIKDFIERDHTVRVPRRTYTTSGSSIEVFSTSLTAMKTQQEDSEDHSMSVDRMMLEYDLPDPRHSDYDFQLLIDELQLSGTEKDVLDMLLKGHTTKEIANALKVTRVWVENKFIRNLKLACVKLGLSKNTKQVCTVAISKVCNKCQESKPISEFRLWQGKYRFNTCRKCNNK
jgi:RNA polymerase sigma factor (sigma-70 family)